MDRMEKGLPLPVQATSSGVSQLTAENLQKEVGILKESRDADRKEMQLLRQAVDDLVQNKLRQIKEESAERNQDLFTLTARVKDLEDWRKFAEGNQ